MAKHNKIKVIGSYDPSDSLLTKADFLDGMHLKKTSVNKIISQGMGLSLNKNSIYLHSRALFNQYS